MASQSRLLIHAHCTLRAKEVVVGYACWCAWTSGSLLILHINVVMCTCPGDGVGVVDMNSSCTDLRKSITGQILFSALCYITAD